MSSRRLGRPLTIAIETVLIGGLVVLFIVILDPQRLREDFGRITAVTLLGLMAFQVGIHAMGMLQWLVLLRQAGIRAGPWKVFRARLSGTAITSLTPAASFAGEPVRGALLKDHATTYRRVFATIAVDKYIELFTKLPMGALGFGFLIFSVHPGAVLVVVSALFVAFSLGIFLLVMVRLFQGGSFIVRLFKRLVRPLARVRLRAAARVVHVVRDFTRSVSHLVRSRRALYLAMLLGVLLSAIELGQYAYVLAVLGVPSVGNAAILYFSHLFVGLVGFIPGNVGTTEGMFLFAFTLLGLGSNRSLIFSIILRIGQLVMVALGLCNLVVTRVAGRVLREAVKGADRIRTGA
ncbi:MAG TPA: lysylphosphatidylglycerol synthase transmembrane domain-containing protein [Spirochaetia bacterium]|nr:lysylphosphatidylglycerol synthase transmembrane domain-containing protein [Spirochaetia bacterium]